MTDDEDPPDQNRDSSLLDLGETFLNAIGDGRSGTEWRDEVEQSLGGEGEIDYDRLTTAGIAAGEQVARLREQARRTPAAADRRAPGGPAPAIETRDIYDTDGQYAGTRLYVSEGDPDAFLSADGSEVVIRYGSTGEAVSLPQPATAIVTDDGPHGGIALFVAYPEGSVLDDEVDTDTPDEPDLDSGITNADDMKWVDETRLGEDSDDE